MKYLKTSILLFAMLSGCNQTESGLSEDNDYKAKWTELEQLVAKVTGVSFLGYKDQPLSLAEMETLKGYFSSPELIAADFKGLQYIIPFSDKDCSGPTGVGTVIALSEQPNNQYFHICVADVKSAVSLSRKARFTRDVYARIMDISKRLGPQLKTTIETHELDLFGVNAQFAQADFDNDAKVKTQVDAAAQLIESRLQNFIAVLYPGVNWNLRNFKKDAIFARFLLFTNATINPDVGLVGSAFDKSNIIRLYIDLSLDVNSLNAFVSGIDQKITNVNVAREKVFSITGAKMCRTRLTQNDDLSELNCMVQEIEKSAGSLKGKVFNASLCLETSPLVEYPTWGSSDRGPVLSVSCKSLKSFPIAGLMGATMFQGAKKDGSASEYKLTFAFNIYGDKKTMRICDYQNDGCGNSTQLSTLTGPYSKAHKFAKRALYTTNDYVDVAKHPKIMVELLDGATVLARQGFELQR